MNGPTRFEIWSRLIAPDEALLDAKAAQGLLQLRFNDVDCQRMEDLSRKANLGQLAEVERQELETFIEISHVLALLQSKARLSLRSQPAA